ncbi:loganic acid O-methyltransferase-like [Rosa sericea]
MSNKATTVLEAHPMNGGDGTYSYTKNSYYQREAANVAQTLIGDVIAMKLDINEITSSSTTAFCIADLGCSVGPNTFVSVENILEAIKHKYQSGCMSSQMPEFQVFFNDHAGNDFNTLFANFPPTRHYFAAGVPGSFHGRLFPKSSLHFVHSSYATHWLSKVPEELTDKNSLAWNKGKIHYTTAPEEVVNAYVAQFAKDMATFLEARAQELVVGGMMMLIMPAVSTGIPHSCVPNGVMFDFMGSILMDMVKEGVISEAEVDSFNLPVYTTSPKEMGELVERNGCFSIERMESTSPWLDSKHSNSNYGKTLSMSLRAGMEGVVKSHFGSEITDQLFNRLCDQSGQLIHQLQESCCREGTQLFVALKRK